MNNRFKILAAAIVSSLAGHSSTIAATITVNSTIDAITGTGPGVCTLRQAINSANQNQLFGDCVVGSETETDQVEFAQALSGSTITLTEGAINIAAPLSLGDNGPQASRVTISGGNSSGIFRVSNNLNYEVIDVTLRGLTLTNGSGFSARGGAINNYLEHVTIEDCTLTDNSASQDGGAIYNRGEMTLTNSSITANIASGNGGAIYSSGQLTLINSTVSNNTAVRGGGVFGSSGYYTSTIENHITIEGGLIRSNSATERGGGIFTNSGPVSLSEVNIEANRSDGSGGGIAIQGTGDLIVNGGQMIANVAAFYGGGAFVSGEMLSDGTQFLYNQAGISGGALIVGTTSNLVLSKATFRGNSAMDFGGAIYSLGLTSLLDSTLVENTASNGAAIFTVQDKFSTSLSMINTTVSGNTATFTDAGATPAAVLSRSDSVINASTFIGNVPAGLAHTADENSWRMKNTVIADSAVRDCYDLGGLLTENVNNFIGDGSCGSNATNLQVGDPMLGPLSEAGGDGPVHYPLPASPLIDSGDTSDCPDFDQLGMPRPIDGNANGDADCDIGAIEYVDLIAPSSNLATVSDINAPGATILMINITYTELDGAVDLLTIDPTDISISPGPLTVQSVSLSGNPSQVVAAYAAMPPGGSWDLADNNEYEIRIMDNAVSDTATTGVNFVPAGILGGFSVAIVDIDVTGAGISISDGDASPSAADGTAFGEVPLQNVASREFIITNLGAGMLNLTSPPEVLGQGFTISQPTNTSLAAGESTQFQVMFNAAQPGPGIGQVTIVSNDTDENPYTFAVSATGIVAQDEIFVDGFEEP